jgi:hypothetical protein
MTENQQFVHNHKAYFSNLQWDGENFFWVMGQFAPNPGEKVVVSDEELGEKIARLFGWMAKNGCD